MSSSRSHSDAKLNRSSGVSLRRSCRFCRARKIRCSGDSNGICSACRARGGDCIFTPESTKGRPKRTVSGSIPLQQNPPVKLPARLRHHQTDPTSDHSFSASGTIGEDLNALYGVPQTSPDDLRFDPWKQSMAALRRKVETGQDWYSNIDAHSTSTTTLQHEGLLGLIAQDLVCMMATQLGYYGCVPNEPGTRLFSSCHQSYGGSQPDAESIQLGSDCLNRIHEQFRFQLIEIWFNHHPLNACVSKTLLLRSYKDGQHDEALLAVMLAGAQHSYKGGDFADVEMQLFDYAEALLHDRPSQSWDLATAQVVLLIGWHELCVRRTRKAAYLIAYAGRIAGNLQQAMASSKDAPKGRANGVDMDSVEAELIRNIYWITFAISLWAFMEVDEPQAFAALLPKQLLPAFPAVDETQSAIMELDLASDNVSTFQSQARTIRGIWPLAHIASTVGHIYALYPQEHIRQCTTDVSWQLRPLHQLRGLLRLDESRDSLCQNIQKVLKGAVEGVEREVRNDVSKALVTAAYLVLIIHLEFPKVNEEFSDTNLAVTTQIVERFCRSGNTLSQIIRRITYSRTSTWLLSTTPMNSSIATPLLETFSSGLEIIGYIASHLVSVLEGTDDAQRQAILPFLGQLQDLVHNLYLSAKETILRSSRKANTAKKMLKAAYSRISELAPQLGLVKEPRRTSVRHSSPASVSEPSDICSWNDSMSVLENLSHSAAPKKRRAYTEVLALANQQSTDIAFASISDSGFDTAAMEHQLQTWAAGTGAISPNQETGINWNAITSDSKLSTLRTDSMSAEYWDVPMHGPTMSVFSTSSSEPVSITSGSDEFDHVRPGNALLSAENTSLAFFDGMEMLHSDSLIMTDAAWDAVGIQWEQAPT